MNPRAKKILQSLGAKVLVSLTGAQGLAYKYLLQKALVYLGKFIEQCIREAQNEQKTKEEKKLEEKYEESLKDGQSESASRDASLDFLNGAK